MSNNKTFVKITNKDIYQRINEFDNRNNKEHEEIKEAIVEIKGRFNLVKWISATALALVLAMLVNIVVHVI
jgi:hypothetical protein